MDTTSVVTTISDENNTGTGVSCKPGRFHLLLIVKIVVFPNVVASSDVMIEFHK